MIKKPSEFDEIFRSGERLSSENFLLVTKESEGLKFGFTVSKKIQGAVKRNREKRRLREIVRLNQADLPNNKSIVLMAKPGIEQTKFERLNKEFVDLLKKLKSKFNK